MGHGALDSPCGRSQPRPVNIPGNELISVSGPRSRAMAASGVGAGFVTPSSARTGVSPDGRFVGFVSFADNLVPGDTNLSSDVFVRDRLAGTTERVSVTSRGREGNGHSGLPRIAWASVTMDAFVVFDSEATNLVRGDANANAEVLLRDRLTGTTGLIGRRPRRQSRNGQKRDNQRRRPIRRVPLVRPESRRGPSGV